MSFLLLFIIIARDSKFSFIKAKVFLCESLQIERLIKVAPVKNKTFLKSSLDESLKRTYGVFCF